MILRIALLFLVLRYSSVHAQISDSEMETLKTKWRVELRERWHELSQHPEREGGASDYSERETGASDFSDSIRRRFLEDTFIADNLRQKQLDKEATTLGINKANLACASEYEKLVEIYFNILLSKMKDKDKDLVISSQKDWKSLMEKERALAGKLMQEEYSGGGSLHSIEYTERLMNQQKNRLLTLINYLTHLI
ncbi:MAG: hypothetical protein K0S23_122 [Fluviicola sp.]|jgi:hypothetical protein|uniref:lysozyme inhibitor LprI family protein n=1 Tax=Fluviicola sp. TaxID=1917219 RepID=UPI002622A5E0|nr:lysozyme inhibitor LprI family protein [Fluviicola sp.]MDF3025815.1 hypothetical protein [Fluviicola sp.]